DSQTQGVPAREDVANGSDFHTLGVQGHIEQKLWRATDLEPLAVQVVLREGNSVEPEVLGQAHKFHHLLKHRLPTLGMAGDGTQPFSLCQGGRNRRQQKQHEFHGSPIRRSGSVIVYHFPRTITLCAPALPSLQRTGVERRSRGGRSGENRARLVVSAGSRRSPLAGSDA